LLKNYVHKSIFLPLFVICLLSQTINVKGQNIQRDSLNYIPSKTIITNKNHNTFIHDTLNRTNPYNYLQSVANKRKWTKTLHDIIILSPSKHKGDTLINQNNPDNFSSGKGKFIRNIIIQKIQPFGSSVYDTIDYSTTWFQKAGNSIHINTNNKIIRKNLLFHKGDQINPYQLADNERILRNLSFLEDARIELKEVRGNNDSVDLVVIAKDIFELGFDVNINNIQSGKIEIWDNNLLGLGNEFQSNINWNTTRSNTIGYEGIYNSKNILGSFVDANLHYLSFLETTTYAGGLSKEFITPSTRYAGGISAFKTSTFASLNPSDTSIFRDPLKYEHFDIWGGRSIRINPSNLFEKNRLNLILSARIYKDHFYERPAVGQDQYYQFHNKTTILGSIALTMQNFYKTNLIYNFGRTEDIPYGFMVNLTGGYELNEFNNRGYLGLFLSSGRLVNGLGYFYNQAELGSFFNKMSQEQGILKLSTNYFSSLYVLNEFKYRHFISFDYTRGIKRFQNEYLMFTPTTDIRGLSSNELIGSQYLKMHLESVLFLPTFFYEFRFALFGFSDMGLITSKSDFIFNHDLYGSIGLGIRMRNERLAFKTIQLRFSYFPLIPSNSKTDVFEITGEDRFHPNDFFVHAPEIFQYK
jgi:hypothetical protein